MKRTLALVALTLGLSAFNTLAQNEDGPARKPADETRQPRREETRVDRDRPTPAPEARADRSNRSDEKASPRTRQPRREAAAAEPREWYGNRPDAKQVQGAGQRAERSAREIQDGPRAVRQRGVCPTCGCNCQGNTQGPRGQFGQGRRGFSSQERDYALNSPRGRGPAMNGSMSPLNGRGSVAGPRGRAYDRPNQPQAMDRDQPMPPRSQYAPPPRRDSRADNDRFEQDERNPRPEGRDLNQRPAPRRDRDDR